MLEIYPISDGMFPLNLFPQRFRTTNSLQFMISFGTSPEKLFSDRSKTCRLQFAEKVDGERTPVKRFSDAENSRSLAKPGHIPPEKLLALRSRDCKFRHSSNTSSTGPVKLFPDKLIPTKLPQIPGKLN
ncbi:hypothetical protein U1Q18_005277 [Sarracenia purpurea var. burkii]